MYWVDHWGMNEDFMKIKVTNVRSERENPTNIILEPNITADVLNNFGLKPNDWKELVNVGEAICYISKIWRWVQWVSFLKSGMEIRIIKKTNCLVSNMCFKHILKLLNWKILNSLSVNLHHNSLMGYFHLSIIYVPNLPQFIFLFFNNWLFSDADLFCAGFQPHHIQQYCTFSGTLPT